MKAFANFISFHEHRLSSFNNFMICCERFVVLEPFVVLSPPSLKLSFQRGGLRTFESLPPRISSPHPSNRSSLPATAIQLYLPV